jgi:hypothetical protein
MFKDVPSTNLKKKVAVHTVHTSKSSNSWWLVFIPKFDCPVGIDHSPSLLRSSGHIWILDVYIYIL